MFTILAHRANVHGPSPTSENRRPAIAAALARGWGLELDIRRSPDGRFYLSHDAADCVDGLLADDALPLIASYPSATIALNVKEVGYEGELLAYLSDHRVLGQVFLFDMELIERVAGETARVFAELAPGVTIAARVSDRGESVDRALGIRGATIVWLDEFDGPWCTEPVVRALVDAGRTVHAVSPDLHRFTLSQSRRRWAQFLAWGVAGICTDYPMELERLLTHEGMEVA